LQKYPSPAAAVNPDVLIVCQDVPPAATPHDKTPDPSVFKTSSALPSDVGKVNV